MVEVAGQDDIEYKKAVLGMLLGTGAVFKVEEALKEHGCTLNDIQLTELGKSPSLYVKKKDEIKYININVEIK